MIPVATHGAAAASYRPLWTPAALTLNVWLDAVDLTTFTLVSSWSYPYVEEWRDKSGNNNHFSQTGGNWVSPRLITSYPNSVQFDGYNATLSGSHGLGANPANFSIFISIRMYNVTSGTCRSKILIGDYNSTSTTGAFIGIPQHYNSTAWGFRSPNMDQNAGLGDADTRTNVYGLIKSGTDYYVSVNGTLSSAISISNNLIFTNNVLLGRSSSNDYFGFELGEFIICPVSLSTSDRQKVEGYLAHKWQISNKLPSNHPYKNAPPYLNS